MLVMKYGAKRTLLNMPKNSLMKIEIDLNNSKKTISKINIEIVNLYKEQRKKLCEELLEKTFQLKKNSSYKESQEADKIIDWLEHCVERGYRTSNVMETYPEDE